MQTFLYMESLNAYLFLVPEFLADILSNETYDLIKKVLAILGLAGFFWKCGDWIVKE